MKGVSESLAGRIAIFQLYPLSWSECKFLKDPKDDLVCALQTVQGFYLLKPYFRNHTKRLVKSSKVFFVDSGLLCYLLGIDSAERFFKAAERGRVFENMVIMEAIKRCSFEGKRFQPYFYRTSSGLEVDLLIEKGNALEAFEIKFSKTIHREMAEPLKIFASEHSLKRASLLSLRE